MHLFEDKGLQPKTIDVYRSAISGALKHSSGLDLGSDQRLSALLKSFHRERPRSLNDVPKWDLSLVLWSLTRPPFEPLTASSMDLELLTWKTAFLILLASGSRRGEIHALTHKGVKFHEQWEWVELKPSPSFISKTQLRSSGSSALQPVFIRALGPICTRGTGDNTLCPVRSLKAYLARTSSLREGKRNLFISVRPGHKGDICKNTLSGWIKKLIHRVYFDANEDACELFGQSAHSVRKYAASLAYKGTVDVEGLLKACSWKSHQTFTNFYLRDISGIEEGLLKLGPIVAAQQVVNL